MGRKSRSASGLYQRLATMTKEKALTQTILTELKAQKLKKSVPAYRSQVRQQMKAAEEAERAPVVAALLRPKNQNRSLLWTLHNHWPMHRMASLMISRKNPVIQTGTWRRNWPFEFPEPISGACLMRNFGPTFWAVSYHSQFVPINPIRNEH